MGIIKRFASENYVAEQITTEINNTVNSAFSLGIASDGLIYLFANGSPVGTGIPQGTNGDVFGYVDENNTIVLNGNLASGTYSIKYEMEDGSTVDIGELELDEGSGGSEPTYTNLATSFAEGKRYSASAGGLVDADGICACTDLIPFTVGSTVRVKGFGNLTAQPTMFYLSDKTTINTSGIITEMPSHTSYEYDSVNDIVTLVPCNSNNAYIRFSGVLTGTTDDVVITVNEPIVNDGSSDAGDSEATHYTNLANATNLVAGKKYSSGSLVDEANACACTEFIPFDTGTVVRVKGLGDLLTYPVSQFNTNKVFSADISEADISEKDKTSFSNMSFAYDSENDIATLISMNMDGYIKLTGILTGTVDDVIITVNEPIIEGLYYYNVLPLATNLDGTAFVGSNGEQGYKTGYRIKGSTGAEEALADECCSGYIPVGYHDRIRIANVTLRTDNASYNQIVWYDDAGTRLYAVTFASATENADGVYCVSAADFTTTNTMTKFRFCCAEITDETIVTIDELIV